MIIMKKKYHKLKKMKSNFLMKKNNIDGVTIFLALAIIVSCSCLAWIFIDIIDRIWDAIK